MKDIFKVSNFQFPYLYKFPGQSSDERILFVTRESDVLLWTRRAMVILVTAVIVLMGFLFGRELSGPRPSLTGVIIQQFILFLSAGFALVFFAIGWWWVSLLWKRSIAIITNKRLVKFISTSPWNRHNLALPLDMIVDTGAYSKGWIQALFKLGTFTARSSASSSGVATDDPDRVNKKYFYIENVTNFEDIHHYLNKVLFVFRQDWKKLDNYRPFLPHLKGDARKEFMKQFPEYWS